MWLRGVPLFHQKSFFSRRVYTIIIKTFTIVPLIKPHREGIGLINTSYSGDYCLLQTQHGFKTSRLDTSCKATIDLFIKAVRFLMLVSDLLIFFQRRHIFFPTHTVTFTKSRPELHLQSLMVKINKKIQTCVNTHIGKRTHTEPPLSYSN